jgi:hypothetical protein
MSLTPYEAIELFMIKKQSCGGKVSGLKIELGRNRWEVMMKGPFEMTVIAWTHCFRAS